MTEQQTFFTALTDVSTSPQETLGTIRTVGNKIYKYVWILNTTATVAGVAGDIAAYYADGYDLHKVCLDKSDADAIPLGAGAIQGTVAGVLTTSYYGWIQIKGPATLNTALGGTPSAGHPLYCDTTDLRLAKAAEADSAAAYKQVCAFAQDVSNKQVILDCPF